MCQRTIETRVNWFQLFVELKSNGWSLYRLVEHLGVSKSTLIGWKMSVEPRHADGERLILLWLEVTQKQRGELPMERRYPNAYSRK